jgi:uncharacterized membrane protein
MRLTPPKAFTFWLAIILGIVGVLVALLDIAGLGTYGMYILAVGFILLALGNLLKGL